eukprot:UN12472
MLLSENKIPGGISFLQNIMFTKCKIKIFRRNLLVPKYHVTKCKIIFRRNPLFLKNITNQ